jgi:hypothetical protein
MFGQNAFADVSFADITSPKIDYTLSCSAGAYVLAGKNATLTYISNVSITRGGAGKKKSKVYKDLRQEVEDDIVKAIAKVTGEDKAEAEDILAEVKIEANNLEAEIKAAEEANIANLQENVMQAQAMALQAEIDRLIQAELDDEESLMLLL